MVKTSGGKLILGAVFFILCSASAEMMENDYKRLVEPEALKEAELEVVWETKLPIKSAENLEQLLVPIDSAEGKLGNRVYGLTDGNFMFSLGRNTGNIIFIRSIASFGLPVVGLGLYGDELFSVAGGELVEINADSGIDRNSKRLEFSVSCPAVRNESHFYVAGTDKRMRVFRAEDKVQVFEVAAEDDSGIISVIADEEFVVFATDTGRCISIASDKPAKLWQFDAAGGIARPIVKDEKSLFAASEDTNIYKLDLRTGELIWKYQTGAMLDKGPRVTESRVYQYAQNEGLSAIDKESGELLWKLENGVDLLAESEGKSYVITNEETLAVMDNEKAKQVHTVELTGVSLYTTNTKDSKIYVADKQGRIACLKPVEY